MDQQQIEQTVSSSSEQLRKIPPNEDSSASLYSAGARDLETTRVGTSPAEDGALDLRGGRARNRVFGPEIGVQRIPV